MRKLRADLPIIIATGYDEAHLDERLRKHPHTAVLNKPYDIAQLQAAIARSPDRREHSRVFRNHRILQRLIYQARNAGASRRTSTNA